MKGRNVGTVRRETSKQGLIRGKDLPIEHPEGCESPYDSLDQITNLTYSLIYGP